MISCIGEFFGFGIVSFLATVVSIYKMVIVQSVSITAFLPLLGAIAEFTWRASSVISTYNNILNDSIYINKFNEFYQYRSRVISSEGEKMDSEFNILKIDHLYFKYADKERYILKDICMQIKPKQKIALVGYNGARKSTLINMLLRLYNPSNGSITYNEKNITEYDLNEYRSKFGVVFQDINMYSASIKENVAMDTKVYSDNEMDNVMNSLHLKDKINNFENGFSTQLTHEFSEEGVMLSIGQSQCLALSRIFINPYTEIYIMDEPTSALDPLAEAEVFDTINNCLADKTVWI